MKRKALRCFLFILAACLTRHLPAAPNPQTILGSGNIGDGYTRGMVDWKLDCLVNFNTPSTRFTTSSFWDGSKATPEKLDWVIEKSAAKGISGILLFEHYETWGPAGGYDKWYKVGHAYAARFRPNSKWMRDRGIYNYGITMFQAFNEPDMKHNTKTPLAVYHDALKGLADGVHSVDKKLKVFPGGYAAPNAFKEFTCGGYAQAVAGLINDGTLAGIDLHTYFGFWTPIQSWDYSSQHNFDAVKKACGITRDVDCCVTELGYGTQTAEGGKEPQKISEETAAGYNLTILWDSLGVVGNKGQSVSLIAHPFTLVLEDPPAELDLAFTKSLHPWVPNPRGLVVKLVADLSKDMRFVSLDPRVRGEYILEGRGRNQKMWVWQNRPHWSSLTGTSYTVEGIPKGATDLEVYGSAGLIRAIPLKGEDSLQVKDLPEKNTYMFVAKGTPAKPTPTATPAPAPRISATPTLECPHQFNFEAPKADGWTTLNQGIAPDSLVVDASMAKCGKQSLKASGKVGAKLGEWIFHVFPGPADFVHSGQGAVFEAWVKLDPPFESGSLAFVSQDPKNTRILGWQDVAGKSGWIHLSADFSKLSREEWDQTKIRDVGLVLNSGKDWTGIVHLDEFDWHP